MEGWQEEQVHTLLTISDGHELFRVLAKLARGLGFDYCAYGLRAPLPVSRPQVITLNNYPAEWWARYQQRNYLRVDPTVLHGLRSAVPLVWSDGVFASATELWEEARAFGLRYGWAQSSRNASGVAGLLTLARGDEPLTPGELRASLAKMVWLVQWAHIGMSQCFVEKDLEPPRLREREITVLRWTAEGKTSSEIAEIIGISERTVNYHINNAVAKLGATNKLAAAVKAAVMGLF